MRVRPITCVVCGAKCACRYREFDRCCACVSAHHKHKRKLPQAAPVEPQVKPLNQYWLPELVEA